MFNNKFNEQAKIVQKNTTFTYGRKTPIELKEENAVKKCNESLKKLNIEKKDSFNINMFKNSNFKFKK